MEIMYSGRKNDIYLHFFLGKLGFEQGNRKNFGRCLNYSTLKKMDFKLSQEPGASHLDEMKIFEMVKNQQKKIDLDQKQDLILTWWLREAEQNRAVTIANRQSFCG